MRDLLEELLELEWDGEEQDIAGALLRQLSIPAAGGEDAPRQEQEAALHPAEEAFELPARPEDGEGAVSAGENPGARAIREAENMASALPEGPSQLSFGRERTAFLRELRQFWSEGGERASEGKTQVPPLALQVELGQRRMLSVRRVLTQGGESAAPLSEKPEQTAAAADARAVDRVFQRDARRYDCGFTLF